MILSRSRLQFTCFHLTHSLTEVFVTRASVLSKTLSENHLKLMPLGTSLVSGGKLAKKPHRNLRPVYDHLSSSTPVGN